MQRLWVTRGIIVPQEPVIMARGGKQVQRLGIKGNRARWMVRGEEERKQRERKRENQRVMEKEEGRKE